MRSILNFSGTLTTDTREFTNSNKLINIPKAIFNTKKYFYYITIPDDTRLDIISVSEYNTNVYSDLIFFINKMPSVFCLPKNSSMVKNEIDEAYVYYTDTLKITDSNLLKTIYADLTDTYQKRNELYRNLRMVKPDYINEVLGVIKNANIL